MALQATVTEVKNFTKPDEVRNFENGKLEIVRVGDAEVGRFTLQPGWQWSKHVKPIAKTDWCEVAHFGHHVSGHMRLKMADGQEFDIGPGSVVSIQPGHDAWVVGNEPVIVIDLQGARDYAKPRK